MKKPSVSIITSEVSGLNVRVIAALMRCDQLDVSRVIFAEVNRPFAVALLKKKVKKIYRIGVIGALIGFCTRGWYSIHSDCLFATCNALNVNLTKVKFLNSSATRGALAFDKPTFILSLGNGYIRSDILGLAEKCALNIHLEKLPDYPGARSVIWRIFNREINTGYAVHEMTPKIDKGYNYSMTEVDIKFKSTLPQTIAYSLEALTKDIEQNIAQILVQIAQNEPAQQQDLKTLSYTTPTFFQFLRILKNFRHLRNKYR